MSRPIILTSTPSKGSGLIAPSSLPAPPSVDSAVPKPQIPLAPKWSHRITKHGYFGRAYPRIIECAAGMLQTRDPATTIGGLPRLTNAWRIADVLDVTEEPRVSAPDGSGLYVVQLRLTGRACCGCLPTVLRMSLPSAEGAASLYRHLVSEMAREPSCMLLRGQLLERAQANKGRSDSFARRKQQLFPPAAVSESAAVAASSSDPIMREMAAGAAVEKATEEAANAKDGPSRGEEDAATALLMAVSEGSLCLAAVVLPSTGSALTPEGMEAASHVWRNYDGQRGSGRCCEKCLMCQNTAAEITWALRPPPQADSSLPPSALSIFAAWRAELERCTVGGGCIAGGAHDFIDAANTEIRLTGPGLCCKRCGLVVDAKSVNEGAGAGHGKKTLVEPLQRRILVLPNMLGQFGPAIRSLKAYRGELQSTPSGRLLSDPRST